MKNFVLFLFLTTGALSAAAQNASAVSSSQSTDSLGTTAYGLPVNKSYVAPDVVERAKKKYGRALYSIEKSTAENCQNSYLVGLIRNGRLSMEWMCDDPKMVIHRDGKSSGLFVYRSQIKALLPTGKS